MYIARVITVNLFFLFLCKKEEHASALSITQRCIIEYKEGKRIFLYMLLARECAQLYIYVRLFIEARNASCYREHNDP